ncbi:ER lumen protein retaining receptor [Geopyxis carbonaria]|nr:ER lumen protein retaining receptor [Geopyxis carbonaria]
MTFLSVHMNIFRLLGDLSHLTSKLILIYTITRLRSAEGISLLTQSMYTLVFATRYLDLLWTPPAYSLYLFFFKLTYLATSAYTLYLMLSRYKRTREGERSWQIAGWTTLFAAVAGPLCRVIFRERCNFDNLLKGFSLVLEAACVLPQLTLLAHTSIPTAITSYYLVALGAYRALYIPNWIIRLSSADDGFANWTSIVWGVVQTALYVEFAWIYWRRQSVRLRSGGGVLDHDEFARGLVLGRIIGMPEDKAGGQTGGGWRGQGLSVSADDFVVGDGEGEEGSGDEIDGESLDGDAVERDVERGLIGGR